MRAAALGMVLLCGIAQGAEPKTVTNTIGMKLIEIPAGEFTMGSPAGEKDRAGWEAQVAVTLTKPFWLGKTEVTQGQWQQVMSTEPWKGQILVQADKDCPATFVDWNDATAFCQKLTDLERKAGKLKANEEYRLPTEAEWEYACRAGTTKAYSFGDGASKLGEYGWFNGNTFGELYAHKVGLKKPNPWGLHDVHGNVWEWCSDWFDAKMSGGTDPGGPEGGSRRVCRGGCWGGGPDICQSARPYSIDPSFRFDILGFRVTQAERPVQLKANTIGMELIEIPAGEFTMGSPAGEKDRRVWEAQVAVTLTKPFWLGKTEVTQGQWKQVMGTEPWEGGEYVQADKDCPATFVSFFDAVEFCDKLTDLERKAGRLKDSEEYRLPTEAEWEYACRAGTTTAFSFGDDSKLNSHAWWGGLDEETAGKGEIKAGPGNAAREPYAHKVGSKKPNPWGLYDMHGNVWEWCSDYLGSRLPGGTNPVSQKGGSFRVDRGGSWRCELVECRSAHRGLNVPSNKRDGLGFRVARSQSVNSIGMELIEIPAGKFTMGSPAGEKYHLDREAQIAVTLTKPFWLGKTEVTQGQWQRVMGTEPWKDLHLVTADKDCAATRVDWDDATAFCQKLTDLERKAGKLPAGESYRLPTEAEWEYACRAGTTTAFSFGDDSKLSSQAWWGPVDSKDESFHKVGSKKPNPWGLYDMHGNVGEWCSDWYGEKLPGGTNPVGPEGGDARVLRGGSGFLPEFGRSAGRNFYVPSRLLYNLGFRVARSRSAQ